MDLVLRDLRIIMGGANARLAKHVVEQSKAVTAAYLQGPGFTGSDSSAETIAN